MVTYVTNGGTQKLHHIKIVKPADMTIHWKALEEHFLMVP
jgi:pyridoxine/pyridoxamine 5'-phosphate oxidase